MSIDLSVFELWLVTGSQHLYGNDVLDTVAEHARAVAEELDRSPQIPVRVVCTPVVTDADAILALCLDANRSPNCIGVMAWMHTFSPAKMWIAGLDALRKPLLHLHTQFNRDIPWSSIDMDFMNLNQSAHGDREFGHICARMGVQRKIVVGHWQDEVVQRSVGVWARATCAWHDARRLRIARFGDNMRDVAVTEGDKVAAQQHLGWSVNGWGLGDLAARVDAVTEDETKALLAEYHDSYTVQSGDAASRSIAEAARIELGLRAFLEEGGFGAFTTTFETLHGLHQLPGLSVQRLMAKGYGFGAEGDWKTAGLLRAMYVMAAGLPGGTSFMEDYTYHLEPDGMQVLGAHMLEICPTIAADRPTLEVHPLSIGGKADPARLVFDAAAGPAVNASLIDMGNRFRLLVNPVDTIAPRVPLPKLPVARALWIPRPSLTVAATAWILAGGAHHTGFSTALAAEHLQDFAEIAALELITIDADTAIDGLKNVLRWNEALYSRLR